MTPSYQFMLFTEICPEIIHILLIKLLYLFTYIIYTRCIRIGISDGIDSLGPPFSKSIERNIAFDTQFPKRAIIVKVHILVICALLYGDRCTVRTFFFYEFLIFGINL